MDAENEETNGLGESNLDKSVNGKTDKTVGEDTKLENSSYPPKVIVEGDINKNITEANEVQSVVSKIEKVTELTRHEQIYENGKRKIKEEKPSTKVVVRRLPPSMTKETFLEQVSPLPPYEYMYFVSGDLSYGIYSFSRAYLNFSNHEDVYPFTRTFDSYVFLDSKGQEYPAIVEFSPFQRVPKQRSKKKDTLTGTIESDPMYISFKENLLAEALENSKPGAKTMKQHYFETEISAAEEVNTTPLLEYLKQRRAEKARIRDERREEKKRKEAERKLKQKAKEKKAEGDEEDVKDIKVLQSKERKDSKENKLNKKKEDKEKLLKENRTREFKNRSGKSYQEERIRQAERREERKKETSGVTFERKSESQCSDDKDAEQSQTVNTAQVQEEKNRPFIEKKRLYESKKKNEIDEWKNEGDGDKRLKTDRNRGERRRERDRKRREEFANRKGFDKKTSENDRKKTKTFRSLSSECDNNIKENIATEGDKHGKDIIPTESKIKIQSKSNTEEEKRPNEQQKQEDEDKSTASRRRKSLESGAVFSSTEISTTTKRRNSLESGDYGNTKIISDKTGKADCKSLEIVGKNGNGQSEQGTRKSLSKNDGERSKQSDMKRKNSEASSNNDVNNCSTNKDPRTDRRIRNKDRPSLQIYRPGMGKFSKQRLEKEKVLGSSTEVDSPSHSPSPTPKVKFSS